MAPRLSTEKGALALQIDRRWHRQRWRCKYGRVYSSKVFIGYLHSPGSHHSSRFNSVTHSLTNPGSVASHDAKNMISHQYFPAMCAIKNICTRCDRHLTLCSWPCAAGEQGFLQETAQSQREVLFCWNLEMITFNRYGENSWACVTGGSDGVGLAVAHMVPQHHHHQHHHPNS